MAAQQEEQTLKDAKKIIVAVHGMGEQVRSETIQALANQLCRYCGVPPCMPLGRFSAELMEVPATGGFSAKLTPDGAGFKGEVVPVPGAGAPGAFLVTTP